MQAKRKVLVLVLGAVGALCALAASQASAIPVRSLTFYSEDNLAAFSATAYSPPTAVGCGARYIVQVNRASTGVLYAQRVGKINVCRDFDPASGWSRGELILTFNVRRWPIDYYFGCIAVSQRLSNSAVSRHGACVKRKI